MGFRRRLYLTPVREFPGFWSCLVSLLLVACQSHLGHPFWPEALARPIGLKAHEGWMTVSLRLDSPAGLSRIVFAPFGAS